MDRTRTCTLLRTNIVANTLVAHRDYRAITTWRGSETDLASVPHSSVSALIRRYEGVSWAIQNSPSWQANRLSRAYYRQTYSKREIMTDSVASSLYRRSLKLALDWAVHRYLWRGQAIYIRSLFEAKKDVREPRQQRVCYSS